jgi:hypothetical protein
MRIAVPNLSEEDQIHQTGIGLINLFGIDLFRLLNSKLNSSEGEDWLTTYRKTSLIYQNYNFNDPSNLLKELLRVSSTPLRKPIKEVIHQKNLLPFFNRFQIILDDRNDWVHHNSIFSQKNLKTLILNIYPIARELNLEMISELDFMLAQLDGIEPDVPQIDNPIVPETISNPDQNPKVGIQSLISKAELEIGSLVEDIFLDFSYVLHLNGEIRNRKTDELLSESNSIFAETIGTIMIARKPSGGRLRITSDGIVAAYFEDHWGYLAKVKPEQWFPGHLVEVI